MRIRRTPEQPELDGVRLDDMTPGSIREVSSSIGAWLIAERYAEPEMREDRSYQDDFFMRRDTADDRPSRPRRRRSDQR